MTAYSKSFVPLFRQAPAIKPANLKRSHLPATISPRVDDCLAQASLYIMPLQKHRQFSGHS